VSSAFAIACVLAACAPRLRMAAMAVACLVALSRIYFGCHYFSDVIAGAVLGAVTATWLLVRTRRRMALADAW
jgi:membrane-associated phospholipid phosphatase